MAAAQALVAAAELLVLGQQAKEQAVALEALVAVAAVAVQEALAALPRVQTAEQVAQELPALLLGHLLLMLVAVEAAHKAERRERQQAAVEQDQVMI